MTRPRWQWRGYLPRPADDGRCTAWGGRCRSERAVVWWERCQPTWGARRCGLSDADARDAAERRARSVLAAVRMLRALRWA